jgi:hypothetical protein
MNRPMDNEKLEHPALLIVTSTSPDHRLRCVRGRAILALNGQKPQDLNIVFLKFEQSTQYLLYFAWSDNQC